MKVAFVTPLHERSAVADVSLRVIGALRHRWDVDIWYPACDRPRHTTVPTVPFIDGTKISDALRAYDLAVFVLGDSLNHLEILQAARGLPGLIILHDWSLTNLFAAGDLINGTDLLDQGARSLGPTAVTALEADRRHPRFNGEAELAEILPMTHVALQHSLGVLTHSHHAASRIRGQTAGSVSVARLPAPHVEVTALTRSSSQALLLVVAGVVNTRKRVDHLLEAVAASDILRTRVLVRVVGLSSLEEREKLVRLAVEVGIGDRLEFTGSLPLQEYERALDQATAFVCLCDPVLEAGSVSLLDGMARGRPVVVYDHGHYAELPHDAVIKVGVDVGQPALVAALESLVDEPVRASAVGEAGRRHVLAEYTASAYADALVEAGDAALHALSLVSGIRRLAEAMSDLGLSRDDYARRSTAAAVAELFISQDTSRGK